MIFIVYLLGIMGKNLMNISFILMINKVPSNYIGNFGIGPYEIKNTLKMLFI